MRHIDCRCSCEQVDWWFEYQFCYQPYDFGEYFNRVERFSSLKSRLKQRRTAMIQSLPWCFWNPCTQQQEQTGRLNPNLFFPTARMQLSNEKSNPTQLSIMPVASLLANVERIPKFGSHVSTTREDPEDEVDTQHKLPSVSKQKQLASLLAGGLAGTLSAAVTCPLEVIKTKLQSSSSSHLSRNGSKALQIAMQIASKEGLRGFFRGLVPTLVGVIPARSTYFWAYTTSKTMMLQKIGESPLVHMLSAVLAGMVSNTITNPIWMLKTRMQLQAGGNGAILYTSYADAFQRIVREEGFRGLYKGLSASYWGVTEGAIHFVVYERLKKWMYQQKPPEQSQGRLSSLEYLSMAALSKLIASATTYPHEVVRTRLREQTPISGALPKYRGVLQSIKTIAQEEGIQGLYSGMGMHLLRVVPNTAIMFLTFELVSRWIENHPLLNHNSSSK
ncbi:Solute carrier family 25 member 36-A [Galdieria sulphuraria]|nr:Solute carrier family 25 member 36-A [Galdieria sulphuraria]